MSPEVCKNEPYSYKSDLWSLGCIIYELCSLKHAFASENLLSLVFAIVKNDYDPVPESYGKSMAKLIAGLLSKDPEKRWGYPEIAESSAFQSHVASEEAGSSIGKQQARRNISHKEKMLLRKAEEKKRKEEQHRRELEKAREETYIRNKRAQMRSTRQFQMSNLGAQDNSEVATDNLGAETRSSIILDQNRGGKALLAGRPGSVGSVGSTGLPKNKPKPEKFGLDAFAPRTELLDEMSDFRTQFTFNEPLIITASRFGLVDWDGRATYQPEHEKRNITDKDGAWSSREERAIKSTGVYDWSSDPNAFPGNNMAAKNSIKPSISKCGNRTTTLLYNTVGSEEYTDDFDIDSEDDEIAVRQREGEERQVAQHIRTASQTVAQPIKTNPVRPGAVPRVFGGLQVQVNKLRDDTRAVLGESEFKRLYTLVRQTKELTPKELDNIAGGNAIVREKLEKISQIIVMDDILSG